MGICKLSYLTLSAHLVFQETLSAQVCHTEQLLHLINCSGQAMPTAAYTDDVMKPPSWHNNS